MDTQDQIEQLKHQVEQLKQQLAGQHKTNLPLPANNLARKLIDNQAFVEDLARFASGVVSEEQVRRKYHLLTEEAWVALAKDDALCERIEEEKVRRVRDGSLKRELAQNHIVAAPGILNSLMIDSRQSAKHRIDAVARLDALADPGSQRAHDDVDRVRVVINLTADTKAKDQEINPADILVIDTSLRPQTDDATPQQIPYQQEAIPPKRGPGRPPGSKNKPKTTNPDDVTPPLPGFAT
jgi:hypothetical protein